MCFRNSHGITWASQSIIKKSSLVMKQSPDYIQYYIHAICQAMILDRTPCFEPAISKRKFSIMLSDYVRYGAHARGHPTDTEGGARRLRGNGPSGRLARRTP